MSGWDDDLDDLDIPDDDEDFGWSEEGEKKDVAPDDDAGDEDAAAEAWGDDLDDLDELLDDEDSNSPIDDHYRDDHLNPPAYQKMHQELEAYVALLPHLKNSMNSLLQAEVNGTADELFQYYYARPELAQYTITKELARMEYMLLPNETDKQAIAEELTYMHSIVPRCANQSLLADLLRVITGHDLLVRPQFMATALASSCQFVISHDSCFCKAALELSVPTEEQRYVIAHLRVTASLLVDPPNIEYRIEDIRTNPVEHLIQSAARLLQDMHPSEELESPVNFRDTFLQQSQAFFTNSANQAAAGMRNAWQDVGAVAPKALPKFLPSDILQQVEQETLRAEPQKSRPRSILGGFMRSLAQRVTLPDEDPELYQEYARSSNPKQATDSQPLDLKFYRTDIPTPSKPARKEPENSQSLKTYRQEEATTSTNEARREDSAIHRSAHRADKPIVMSTIIEPPRPSSTIDAHAPTLVESTTNMVKGLHGVTGDDAIENQSNTSPSPEALDLDAEEGWGDDEILDDLAFGEDAAIPTESSPKPEHELKPSIRMHQGESRALSSKRIDDEPRLKRWVNPRPGPRVLPVLVGRKFE